MNSPTLQKPQQLGNSYKKKYCKTNSISNYNYKNQNDNTEENLKIDYIHFFLQFHAFIENPVS